MNRSEPMRVVSETALKTGYRQDGLLSCHFRQLPDGSGESWGSNVLVPESDESTGVHVG